jgi:Zn-finger nucleic acid-binding protein
MRDVAYEGVRIHTCDGCGGEFIGSGELALIVRTRNERFPEAEAVDLSQIKPTFGVPASEKERTLSCPECASSMSVVNYGGDSGIFVDRCSACGGLFLDSGELENVQILMEHWADQAPQQIRSIAGELELTRRKAAEAGSNAFRGSRFSFVNALINRFLDAA